MVRRTVWLALAISGTASLAGQTPTAFDQFAIRLEGPARVGFPLWIHAALPNPLTAR